jgi:transposase (fragment)
LVTETAQYSALHCFFNFKQNDEYLLISNTLRFICSILLALAFYFILHVARHTFATFALANGVSIESVAKMLGHTNVQMTRHYARVLDRTVIREMSQIKMDFHFSM